MRSKRTLLFPKIHSSLAPSLFAHDCTPGNITLQIIGYDHILDAETHGVWTFSLPGEVALYARFADMVVTCESSRVFSAGLSFRPFFCLRSSLDRQQHTPPPFLSLSAYREAILSGTYRPVLDMANFNRVQHSERAKEALSNLNLCALRPLA